MHPSLPRRLAPISRMLLLLGATSIAISGCVVARNASGAALQPGQEASITGRVVAIDTAPWAYDGNAVIQVATEAHGIVQAHLPARWNLCAAPPVDVEALAIGDDVHATGTAGAEGELVVCARATHFLRETD